MSERKILRSRWTRLAAMSRDEVRTRGRQEISKRFDATIFRLVARFTQDGFKNPANNPSHFFFAPGELSTLVSLLRHRLPGEVDQILGEAERICQHRFDLLGYQNLDYGREIDWHLDLVHGKRAPRKPWYKIHTLDFAEVGDPKITWELNRHQHLVTLAKAYCLTRKERFAEELLRQWYHWQQKNPYPIGINWASSLEVAFRSLAWIWSYHLLASWPAKPERFEADFLRALALSGRHIERYLSTYSSPNTHLLGEGVGLFFIGTLYPQIPAARLWQERGWEIVLRGAERQVRPDGFYFEESGYYHVYALDFLLHARVLASCNDIPIPREFDETIEKMLEVLAVLGQAGPLPRIGDDDGGRVFNPRRDLADHMMDPLSTGAVIFGSPAFKAAADGLREETIWLLGPKGAERFDEIKTSELAPVSAQFADSGIYVMVGAESSPRRLTIAAGPHESLTCGHAHADKLSVQLTVNRRDWLVDPATFCYSGDRGQREVFRGTAAHNTLRVDGLDQSEMAGPFGWRSPVNVRGEQWIAGRTFDLLAGSHTGYCRLPKPVVHERWVVSIKDRFWLVRDLAKGEGQHQLDISWHLAANFGPRCSGESPAVHWTRDREGLAILPVEGHGWSQQIGQGQSSPVYGRQEPCPVLNFSAAVGLPVEFGVLVLPMARENSQLGVLRRIDDGTKNAVVRAYRYSRLQESHLWFFAGPGQQWELNSWSSDAEFVYCGLTGEGNRHWIFCGGSYVEVNGSRVIECKHSVERFERWSAGAIQEVSCSDDSAIISRPEGDLASVEMALLGQRLGELSGRAN